MQALIASTSSALCDHKIGFQANVYCGQHKAMYIFAGFVVTMMANSLCYLIADDMSLWRAGVHLPSILISRGALAAGGLGRALVLYGGLLYDQDMTCNL